MPDDTKPPSQPDHEQPQDENPTPSTLFLEMMRQAAARHYPPQEPLNTLHQPTDEVAEDNEPEVETPSEPITEAPKQEDKTPADDIFGDAAEEKPILTPSDDGDKEEAPQTLIFKADEERPTAPTFDSSKVIARRPDDWMPPKPSIEPEQPEGEPQPELEEPVVAAQTTENDTLLETPLEPITPVAVEKDDEEYRPKTPLRRVSPTQHRRPDLEKAVARNLAKNKVPIYVAPVLSEEEREEKLEEQRVQRLRRRQERRRRNRVGAISGFIRTIFVGIFAAALASTIFTWFINPEFIQPSVVSGLYDAEATSIAASDTRRIQPTATPLNAVVTPNWAHTIGIVAGHRGPGYEAGVVDVGAVCPDGLTELEINFDIAQRVVEEMRGMGYTVDLLDEFDSRLDNYQASALVSLHSNDCRDYGPQASTFLVSRAASRPPGGRDDILAECIGLYYRTSTTLERSFNLTIDMTDYHTFREIHPNTPAAILEMGFMLNNRDLLTQGQDLIVRGVVDGIECFLNGENPLAVGTPTPVPTIEAEATIENEGQ